MPRARWCPMAPVELCASFVREGSPVPDLGGRGAGTSIAQVRAVGASKNIGVWDWPRGGVGLVVVVRSTADVASCGSSQNTRFYDLVPREVGGTQVTPHSRIERFDGSTVNNRTGLSVASA